MERAKGFLKRAIELIKKPEMRILPGNLAFFFVMSLIPIIALLGALASKFSISLDTIKAALGIALPEGVEEFIHSIVAGKGLSFNIGVFFFSAFVLASNGTHSIIIASNEIYKIKPKDAISRRIKAILMTVVLVEIIFFLLIVPVFGDSIFGLLKSSLGNDGSIELLYRIYKLLKYTISAIIIYFNIKLIYVIAPDAEIGSSTTTKGAIFTTISWIICSEIYSFYLDTFTKYDIFYGSISNIIILLLWVYMLSYIFVLGLVINAGSRSQNTKSPEVV